MGRDSLFAAGKFIDIYFYFYRYSTRFLVYNEGWLGRILVSEFREGEGRSGGMRYVLYERHDRRAMRVRSCLAAGPRLFDKRVELLCFACLFGRFKIRQGQDRWLRSYRYKDRPDGDSLSVCLVALATRRISGGKIVSATWLSGF